VTDRKKPGVAFWASVVVVVLPLLYVLSFGPACWIASRTKGKHVIPKIYWPISWVAMEHFWTLSPPIAWYAQLGMPEDGRVYLPMKSGELWLIDRRLNSLASGEMAELRTG
jgi:hypothetical protein